MGILGNYVLFFISMMGMILADNDDKYQEFYKDLLELHKHHRIMHGAKALIMDAELSKKAMKIAKYVDKEPNPEFSVDIGTNFYYEYLNIQPNAKVVFNFWYDEGQYYTHNDDPIMRLETSAFTQIVWKSTTHIGMAVHPGQNHLIIVVTYSPPGNESDGYLKNVVAMKDRIEYPLGKWGTKKLRTKLSFKNSGRLV